MNVDMLYYNTSKWCGKEVQVFLPDGRQFEPPEGPFCLWDACFACSIEAKIDFPAKSFVEMKGGTCWGRNVEGLRVKVLDNSIWHYNTDGTGGRLDTFEGARGTAVGTGPAVTGPGGVPFPSKSARAGMAVPQVSGEPGKGKCPLGEVKCAAGYKYTCTEINPGNLGESGVGEADGSLDTECQLLRRRGMHTLSCRDEKGEQYGRFQGRTAFAAVSRVVLVLFACVSSHTLSSMSCATQGASETTPDDARAVVAYNHDQVVLRTETLCRRCVGNSLRAMTP